MLQRSLTLGIALLLGNSPAPAFAQQLGGAQAVQIPVFQLIAGLLLCSLAAFAVIALMRRQSGVKGPLFARIKWKGLASAAGPDIKVLESHRLSLHADVCRFTAGGREYLIVVTAGGATIIKDAPIADRAPDPGPGASA